MKVGIVVDGSAEAEALQGITRRLKIQGTNIVPPIYADMQPKATPAQVAKAAKEKVDILLTMHSVDQVLVLIDREDNGLCPAVLSAGYKNGFEKLGYNQTVVVVKNRQFENWLIADPAAFRRAVKHFTATSRITKRTVPNRADDVEHPLTVINQATKNGPYHKRRDAARISQALDIDMAARNSRSFRRFLRVLNHESYLMQSREPLA